MSHIPSDICRQIFLRLPAKSLIRFRAVCKAWRAVIDDPCFVKAHTNNQLSSNTLLIRNSTGPPFYPLYSFDLDALNFTDGLQTIPATPLNFTSSGLSRLPAMPMAEALPVAACNGLMLIAPSPEDHKRTWEIWNPLTHERLELPQRNFNTYAVGSGLGYDYAADDYKAVVIDCRRRRRGGKYVYRTHVYSLKSDSWRKIRNCPCDLWDLNSPGVFLRGALHWISRDRDMIIALDLGTENYRQLQLPPLQVREEMVSGNQQLDVLGGCLILSDYGKDDYMFEHFDGWVMKEYGAEDSWMKLFCLEEYGFPDLRSSRPVAYMKNKMQIFMQDYTGFFSFDVESNAVKVVSIHGLSGILSAQICPGTIFRLHDNCGVSGIVAAERRMRKRERKSKMKMADTKLMFCVREKHRYESHDGCYSLDSNWYYSSSEGDD